MRGQHRLALAACLLFLPAPTVLAREAGATGITGKSGVMESRDTWKGNIPRP